MLIVGLTGGIASGKSTVADMFKRQGASLIDIDQISREVVAPVKPAWQEIVHLFGEEVLHNDQTLNRKKLGDIVFSDPAKRKKLEGIIHPKITVEKVRKIKQITKDDTHAIVVIDIPLLIETNKEDTVDRVVLVYVSPQTQIERLTKRDGLSVEDAQRRLAAQMPIDDKKKYAHYIINNEGPFGKTEQEVKEVFQKLTSLEAQHHRTP